jgi:hypothetical protein
MASHSRIAVRGLLTKQPHCHNFFLADAPATWDIRGSKPPKVLGAGDVIAILHAGGKNLVPLLGNLAFVEAIRLDTNGQVSAQEFDAQYANHRMTAGELADMRVTWNGTEVWAWKFTDARRVDTNLSIRRVNQDVWISNLADKVVKGQSTLALVAAMPASSSSKPMASQLSLPALPVQAGTYPTPPPQAVPASNADGLSSHGAGVATPTEDSTPAGALPSTPSAQCLEPGAAYSADVQRALTLETLATKGCAAPVSPTESFHGSQPDFLPNVSDMPALVEPALAVLPPSIPTGLTARLSHHHPFGYCSRVANDPRNARMLHLCVSCSNMCSPICGVWQSVVCW